MKVAIVAPLVSAIREPQVGGSQAFLSDLASGLAGRGHVVDVYAAAGSQLPGITVIDTGVDPASLQATRYRAGNGRPDDLRSRNGEAACASGHARDRAAAAIAFARVYEMVRETRYDVIHNHAFDAPAIALASTLDMPVVHTLHLPPDPAIAAALREAAGQGRAPAVAGVSAFQASAWRRAVPVDAILPSCVPTRAIPWSPAPGEAAVFAGRLSPEKGAAEAIDIARTARMPIEVYGDVYDTRYAREQIGPRRGVPGVVFHGGVSRRSLWAAMSSAAVVLCPARWDEPFGMAAAEAQACGTPVVAFCRGGLTELIAHGVTGFLVAPEDIGAAADGVRRVSGISRSACREHAERHLDLERSLDAHERLYARVISAGAGTAASG
jgi:glycosyltransferase involved in cell wall biosynthesis